MPSTEAEPGKGRLSELRVGLWVVALLFSLFCLALLYLGQGKGSGATTDSEMANAIGGPFTLTAPDGSTVTDKTLAGKPFAIFFGFTRCPDVCPTNLARMARLRTQLKGDGDKFAGTIDHQEDDASALQKLKRLIA